MPYSMNDDDLDFHL